MDKLRDFLKSWPGKVLLALCLAPMVLLGLEGYLHQGQLSAHQVAKVGDTTIELASLQAEMQARRASLLETVDASAINEHALLEQTLELMINRALLEEQAQAMGMQVSDATITQILQNEPIFLDNGVFSNALFAQFLQSRGMTKDRLFAEQRRELNLRTLMNGILTNAIYPNLQVNRLIDLQLESRPLWVKRIGWQPYASQVSVSDDEIDRYYNAHKDALISPEMVDLTYIELPITDIEVNVNDDELKQAYTAYLRQNQLGQKRLAQILLTGDNVASRVQQAQKELADGADFASVAKKYSDDPSGQTGGDIGSYNPAVFGSDASRVDNAIATLSVGEVSQPVPTQFGTHLFQVIGADDAPSFDGLKDTLTEQVLNQKRQAAFADKVATVNNLVADGFGIKDIANQLQLSTKTLSDYSNTAEQTLLSAPAIKQAAFDSELLAQGGVSANIDLAGTTIWLEPNNYRPSTPMSKAAATDNIKQMLIQQKASALALMDAEAEVKTLTQDGLQPAALAEFTALGSTTRQSPVLNDAERASLFSHKTPSQDGRVAWAVPTDTGVSLMVGGDIATEAKSRMSDSEKSAVATMMKTVAGQDYLEDYLRYLRSVYQVQINDELLKTL